MLECKVGRYKPYQIIRRCHLIPLEYSKVLPFVARRKGSLGNFWLLCFDHLTIFSRSVLIALYKHTPFAVNSTNFSVRQVKRFQDSQFLCCSSQSLATFSGDVRYQWFVQICGVVALFTLPIYCSIWLSNNAIC